MLIEELVTRLEAVARDAMDNGIVADCFEGCAKAAWERAQRSGNESALKAMMRDPRYWRERDPDFIKCVSDAFSQLYAKQPQ